MTCRVGIIEDNEDLARLVRFHLEANHCTVLWCSHEGLDAIKGEDWGGVEVVVVDWRLPGGEGGDVIKWVKESHPEVKAIVVTALPESELPIDRDCSPDAIFIKPYEPSVLVETIRAFSHREQGE